MTRRRLNDMRFCVCGHGQGAHHNGRGRCAGERRIGGVWWPCACQRFQAEPDEEDEA